VFASGTAALFGLYEQVSVWGMMSAIPVTAWEMSLAVYLIVKGFKAPAVAPAVAAADTRTSEADTRTSEWTRAA
ncbi:MAG: DUF4386 domain-containing protein, partial [Thermoleophilia bacterium]|nr:DUF4386 domain-containing protein [Thermoleophilia bacterium]